MTTDEAAAFAAHLATLGVLSLQIRWTPREDGTGHMAVTGWTSEALSAELAAWRASQ